MKCENHPEIDSVSTCALCGGYYCDACIIEIDGKDYCRQCIKQKIVGEPSKEETEKVITNVKKSKFLALMFSLVPGVGYLYLGLMKKGLQTMIAFFGSLFIANFISFEEASILLVPVLIFYSIFDTQQLVRDLNEGLPIEDKALYDITKLKFNQKWIGYGLILVGVLAFVNSLPFGLPYWVHRMIPPVLMIAAGVAILYRNMKKENF